MYKQEMDNHGNTLLGFGSVILVGSAVLWYYESTGVIWIFPSALPALAGLGFLVIGMVMKFILNTHDHM